MIYAKKKCEWYEDANLHVIERGNHISDIFKDKTDYELYLNYLHQYIGITKDRIVECDII